jgi:hypothetical protein
MHMFTKKTIIIMSVIIGILIVFIAILLIWQESLISSSAERTAKQSGNNSIPAASTTPAASVEQGKKATTNLINELKQEAANPNSGSPAQIVTINRVVNGQTVTDQAVTVAKGTSPISVTTGEVIAKNGGVAQNSGMQGSVSSPTQSLRYLDPSKLPASTIKITLNSDYSLTPNSFTVHPGQVISLAIINYTPWSERIIFDDSSLSAIIFSLIPKSTQAMTFTAPSQTGQYVFSSDVSWQRSYGMKGTMVVQ